MNTNDEQVTYEATMKQELDTIREALVMARSAFRENGYDGEDKLSESLAAADRLEAQLSAQQQPIRREVRNMCEQMEVRLRANDHKGGWHNMSWEHLLDLLKEEVAELEECFDTGSGKVVTEPAHITAEAADVANFAMMLMDNFGTIMDAPKLYVPQQQSITVVTHMNMDPNASAETKAAVAEVVQAAYNYKPQQQPKRLSDDDLHRIADECFGYQLNRTTHGESFKQLMINGARATCSDYFVALRYARDNGYITNVPTKRLTDDVIENYVRRYKHPYSTEIRRAITHFRDQGYLAPTSANRLTDDEYQIIADRMVEEHRKYATIMPEGMWAGVAARKVVSHLRDQGYLGGLSVDEVMEVVMPYLRKDNPYWTEKMLADLRARLTSKMNER